jgi:hypothetical protein
MQLRQDARAASPSTWKGLAEIVGLPDLQKRLTPLGYDLAFAGSDRFRVLIVNDHKRYGAVIREAGIAPN